MTPIFLDHAATTPVLPEVREAVVRALTELSGNPSSAHAAGRRARQVLEDARERVAALLNAEPDEVLFTSGATEANNLAIFGLAGEPPGRIAAGSTEHPCVVEPLARLAARGFTVEHLPVDRAGIVDVSGLMPAARLLTLHLVNHETGAIQTLPRKVANFVHTDAAQAVGKIPVDFRALDATALTVSGHKFGGPPGIGALLVKKAAKLQPLFLGGHQQRGLRPGTEPVALAAGIVAALEVASRRLDSERERIAELRRRLLDRLNRDAAALVVNGDGVPHVLNVSFPGCAADRLLIALDLAGVACSTGSACSSGSLLPSPVLRAMGAPDDELRSAMRFSFGWTTTTDEIDSAAERIADAVRRMRQ